MGNARWQQGTSGNWPPFVSASSGRSREKSSRAPDGICSRRVLCPALHQAVEGFFVPNGQAALAVHIGPSTVFAASVSV